MELQEYLRLLRRWFWLVVLAAFITGGTAFLFRSRQVAVYQAQVTLSVGGFIDAPNPNSSEIRTGMELSWTYVHLAKTYKVLEATVEAGDFPLTAKQLDGALGVSWVEDTSLIKLIVSNPDPALALNLADELANQLILNSPSNLTPQQQNQIDLATEEIDRLEQQLEQERLRLTTILNQIDSETDPAELERLNEQYDTILANINLASANIAQFSDTLSFLQQRSNSLDIVDPARILVEVPGTNVFNATLLGAMVGAALGFGVALLVEYLDNSIRRVDEVTQVLGLPALAAIPRFGKRNADYEDQLITFLEPQSPVAEEYRALRTNIMFTTNGATSQRAYVITSAGPGEGKTLTTANMAVAMAMAGWRVLLVDADLRRPRVHELFGVENQTGLTTLLSAVPHQVSANETRRMVNSCIQETTVPGLLVMTSGYIPMNPTEVLGSMALREWYQILQSEVQADIILFDTPPILAVADAPVLASSLELPAVLVVRAGQTRPGALLRAKEKMMALDIEIKGFVLNALNPRDQGDDYDQSYYYYYYRDRTTSKQSPEKSTASHE